jgi:hypothetical protein
MGINVNIIKFFKKKSIEIKNRGKRARPARMPRLTRAHTRAH